jgi:hypothetical protein
METADQSPQRTARPLTRVETAALADDIRQLLADPDRGLSALSQARWQGALAALEAVLGLTTTLLDDDPGLR